MRNDKQRLFEVMGRLDKTFKPKLNEGFEEIEATDDVELPAELGSEEAPVEEKSPEEKLQELTAKVDELYAMLHGEESGEEAEEIEMTTGEVEPENLQEWNFDKKKGEEHKEKAEDKEEDEKDEEGEEHEKKESPEFEKGEEEGEKEGKKELDEAKPKVPVAAIAKVGK